MVPPTRTRIPVALLAWLVVGLGTLPPGGPAPAPDAGAVGVLPDRTVPLTRGLPASPVAESGPDEVETSHPDPVTSPPVTRDGGVVRAGARLSDAAIDGATRPHPAFPGAPPRAPPVLSD